ELGRELVGPVVGVRDRRLGHAQSGRDVLDRHASAGRLRRAVTRADAHRPARRFDADALRPVRRLDADALRPARRPGARRALAPVPLGLTAGVLGPVLAAAGAALDAHGTSIHTESIQSRIVSEAVL